MAPPDAGRNECPEGATNMTQPGWYHEGSRRLQDRFDTRRIADRLEQVTLHSQITEHDREFIERSIMFFLATVDLDGRPDVSYKGGMPGFVRVLDERTLAFPDYDGNGMFRSLGNVSVNPSVALLFIDFERPNRLRLHGRATLSHEDPLLSEYPGAQLIVRVEAERIFPNCPRYIHKMHLVSPSVYAPRHDYVPPEPDWKRDELFRDALPGRSGDGPEPRSPDIGANGEA
jgi:predicted pyridoxine 5'-phosphate oxidase superfamily flavin-nucleotide-binding protein